MAYNKFYGAKTDSNHADLIKAMRKIPNLSVCDLSGAGGGVPDVMLGYKGRNLLIEIKRDDVSASRSKLNPLQVEWHDDWHGQVTVIRTFDEVLYLLGLR